jgi:nitrite reductase/ring-hydroxylating ferredoxin subunit
VGAASSFEPGTITRFDEGPFFVGRDDDGLYALAAVCPHDGCRIDAGETELVCPCHGSTFAFDGALLGGPALVDLEHLSLVVESSGRVVVDTNVSVAAETRVPVS